MLARIIPVVPLAAILACAKPAARDVDRPDATRTANSAGKRVDRPSDADRSASAPVDSPADPAAEEIETQYILLEEHNRYRAQHCAPPLTWSSELADAAEQWARELQGRSCPLQHSRLPHGENLAAGTAGALDAKRVVDLWYEEIEDYNFESPGFSMQTGHFTQLVWASTRELGCANVTCPGMDLWICHYSPAGNTLDFFDENVHPTSCER
jgi:uncharacterized protein YkwD